MDARRKAIRNAHIERALESGLTVMLATPEGNLLIRKESSWTTRVDFLGQTIQGTRPTMVILDDEVS